MTLICPSRHRRTKYWVVQSSFAQLTKGRLLGRIFQRQSRNNIKVLYTSSCVHRYVCECSQRWYSDVEGHSAHPTRALRSVTSEMQREIALGA